MQHSGVARFPSRAREALRCWPARRLLGRGPERKRTQEARQVEAVPSNVGQDRRKAGQACRGTMHAASQDVAVDIQKAASCSTPLPWSTSIDLATSPTKKAQAWADCGGVALPLCHLTWCIAPSLSRPAAVRSAVAGSPPVSPSRASARCSSARSSATWQQGEAPRGQLVFSGFPLLGYCRALGRGRAQWQPIATDTRARQSLFRSELDGRMHGPASPP